MAEQFVTNYGTTFTMLWDESFESWVELEIPSQPAAILFAADGTELKRWQGVFPEDEVIALASASA